MYIELFLLDNFIFDMLIIYIASALCRAPFSFFAAAIICIVLSIYAAFAQNNAVLRSLPFKLILCAAASVPFYVKSKKTSLRIYLYVMGSAMLCGGVVFALSYGTMRFTSSVMRMIIYPSFNSATI